MKKKPPAPAAPVSLRHRAETKIREHTEKPTIKDAAETATADAHRLLHELQVHQIELEMQNAELRQTREALEASLAKYTELYDFAPVGYFTVDAEGRVQRVNLPGARQVGLERGRVNGTPFVRYLSVNEKLGFQSFLNQVFSGRTMLEEVFEMDSGGEASLKFVRIRAQCGPDEGFCSLVVVDITARKEAEDKLRISEIRYRRLFEAARDGVLLLNPATRKITDANPFMTTLLGYPHDELVGQELFEIGLLKDEAESQEMFRKMKRQSQVRYEHLPLENRDGQHQDVEVVANLYEENGSSVIQCNIRDITERKKIEDALRESEWQLRYATASAKLTFVEVNLISGTVHPASNFAEVLGYAPTRGEASADFSHYKVLLLDHAIPEDRLRVSLALDQFIGKRDIGKLDYRVRGDDGQERWIESRWKFEKNPDGRPLHTFATYLDVTERMQAAAALRLSEERYRTLFNSMDEGYCIIDLIFDGENKPIDWWFLEVNPSFEQHTGIRRSAGRRALEIMPGLEEDWFETYGRIALTGEPLRFIKKAEVVGNRWFELYAFRVGGEESRKVAVIFNNISSRIATEGELREKARLLDLSHDAIIVRDKEGRISYWNHGAEELYGWSREEALGKVSHRLLRTEFPTPAELMLEELHRTGRWTGELIHRKRNGRKVTVLVRKTQDFDSEGHPTAVVENITDITERKAAEATQRKLEVVTASNQKLEQEILRRQAVENSLQLSEQEQRRLLEQSQQQQQQLRRLSHLILNAQEEERKRISRELHDVIAQTLVSINVQVAALARTAPGADTDFGRKITRTRELVEHSVSQVHEFARELRPTMLDDLGLIPALQSSMQTFMEQTGVRVRLQAFAGVEQCSDDLRTVLYRMAQEGLANVARHAEATEVEIRLLTHEGRITMEIQDDGKGFALESLRAGKKAQRLGLLGMRERVEMVGGKLSLQSAPGQPTTVTAEFPAPCPPAKKTPVPKPRRGAKPKVP